MVYLLPNGNKIDEEGLAEAFGDLDVAKKYFLDTETGHIRCVEEDRKTKNFFSNKNRYIEILKVPALKQLSWLREFVHEMIIPDGEIKIGEDILHTIDKAKTQNVGEVLKLALEKLEKDPSGWIHGWAQWQFDHTWEEINEWFYSLPIEIEDKFEGFDDCELCKLMEQGEHSEGDFLEAKQKQDRKKKDNKE